MMIHMIILTLRGIGMDALPVTDMGAGGVEIGDGGDGVDSRCGDISVVALRELSSSGISSSSGGNRSEGGDTSNGVASSGVSIG